ncbi:transposase, partial [Eggerthella lenta]
MCDGEIGCFYSSANSHKRFVGVDCVDTESHAGWKAFLSGLRARGVDGVRLVVSDAH